MVAGVALSAAFLGAAPPHWDALAPPRPRPVRVAEWLVPIAVLDALFVTFVSVQLAVLFGGHRHVLETSGLTYAEYARSGFGQLVVVTLLTLSVVAATVRWAPQETQQQRVVLRALLGVLCALCLVIVGSALYRLHLYEEAFGFTRLRLFMNAFETWLGVLVVLVLVAGVRLRAAWLARAVVATAAARPADPRRPRTPTRSWPSATSSGTRAPARSTWSTSSSCRPTPCRSWTGCPSRCGPACWPAWRPAERRRLGRLGGWNLGRSRAADLLAAHPVVQPVSCQA